MGRFVKSLGMINIDVPNPLIRIAYAITTSSR